MSEDKPNILEFATPTVVEEHPTAEELRAAYAQIAEAGQRGAEAAREIVEAFAALAGDPDATTTPFMKAEPTGFLDQP